MMKEEQFIRKLTEGGGGNPFRVPEGYFESFNRRLNERPEMQRRRIAVPHRLWYVAAVVTMAAVLSLPLLLTYFDKKLTDCAQGMMIATASAADEPQYSDDYVYEVMDYAMVGNMEIEDYLTRYE